MRFFLAISVLVLLVTATVPAFSDTAIINLPELTGDYETDPYILPEWGETHRQMDLVLPDNITAIDEIHLVITGSWTEGIYQCSGYPPQDPVNFTPPMTMFLSVPEVYGTYPFVATIEPLGNEPNQYSAIFENNPFDPDPSLMIGETIHIELIVDFGLILTCYIVEDSYGTLTDVHLEISGTVPAETTTWGHIKGIYR